MEYRERATQLQEETVLSEREAEVVALRATGETYRQVADELSISPQAAHAHARRAKEKAQQAQSTTTLLQEIGFIEND
jgi:DNA-binding CsgD family transcriptional regulator